MLDLVISNGTVIDGTGRRGYQADVGVASRRIVTIGQLADTQRRNEIDASGQLVCPGFIDVHNHSDGWFLRGASVDLKILQGFTTEVLMSDGISYAPLVPETVIPWFFYLRSINGLTLDDYLGWTSITDVLERIHGRNRQHGALQAPYGNIRSAVAGFSPKALDDYQQRQVIYEVERAIDEGAVGLSTGLDYIPQMHASLGELVAACRPLARHRAVYATHVRYKSGLVAAVDEAIAIGRQADVPVHISHLKAADPVLADQVLASLDAASHEMAVSFDIYPYVPGCTLLGYLLPYEVWDDGPLAALSRLQDPAVWRRLRAGLDAYGVDLKNFRIAWTLSHDRKSLQGMTLQEYVDESPWPVERAICQLLIDQAMAVLCVVEESEATELGPFLAHPLSMIATDGVYFPDGQVHPRVAGTVGRWLGHWVRRRKLVSWEDGIRKLSGFPAERFQLAGRGTIQEGAWADLVVLDPEHIIDEATFDEPLRPTQGIRSVIVEGRQVVRDGQMIDDGGEASQPGRALRRGAID